MTKINAKGTLDASTEERIKNAARTVFHKKGYAATRTRDIAEEAGINLALLNYYFRSKEKLFEIIMLETLIGFSHGLQDILTDEHTTFEQKIEQLVANYLDMFAEESDIPMFVLSEIRNRLEDLFEKLPIKVLLENSVFVKQFQEKVADGQIKEPNILHLLMNLLGVIVFPFVGQPLIMAIGGLDKFLFNQLMQERKKLIPVWINVMLGAK
jgi:AcrR family transcriptional regulator